MSKRFALFHSIGLVMVVIFTGSIVSSPRLLAQAPIGPQFTVSTLNNSQGYSALAMGPSGELVVVWTEFASQVDNGDSSEESIQGQRLASDGSLLGDQFLVNTDTLDAQVAGRVDTDGEGNFVVVWTSLSSSGSDSAGSSIQGQRFASDGTKIGSQFQVNSYTTYDQTIPDVAVAPDGRFIVVWQRFEPIDELTADATVQAQLYSLDGLAVGLQFTVGDPMRSQLDPRTAFDSSGRFVVVWRDSSYIGPASGGDIHAQLFDSNGSPLSSEIIVNTYTITNQRLPAVTMNGAGDFVVAWTSFRSPGNDVSRYSVQVRRFSSHGLPKEDQMQVNTYTTFNQAYPAVSLDPNGNFIVVWNDTDFSENDSKARYFSNIGGFGPEFQLHEQVPGFQGLPDVAIDPQGRFAVTWREVGGLAEGTQGRLFLGAEIFKDGFESGDVLAWSTSN